jgi:hypothetical protein
MLLRTPCTLCQVCCIMSPTINVHRQSCKAPAALGGRAADVFGSSTRPPTNDVQTLQRDIDTEEFQAHFAQYGAIEDAAIVSDGTGVSRGFGFVTYSDPLCIEKALIVKHVLRDRQVDCKRAVPKEDIANSGMRPHPVRPSSIAFACLHPPCAAHCAASLLWRVFIRQPRATRHAQKLILS